MDSTPFVTDISSLPHTTTYRELNTYLNSIKSKLSYADFKQQITLLQNYEPLSKIIRRTKAIKQQHQQKHKEDEGLYDWYYEERKDTQQYLKKLESQLIHLKERIEVTSWKRQELKGEVEERTRALKEILNENKDMMYEFIERKVVPQSLNVSIDFKRRAHSYNSLKNLKDGNPRTRQLSHVTHSSHKTLGAKSIPALKPNKSSRSIKSLHPISPQTQNRYLFQQCILHLSKSIKTNTSSNVQTGIFLDILQTSKPPSSLKPRKNQRVSNNLVYEVLLNSYKQSEKKSSVNSEQEIKIEWDTFRKFNGKQVFGLLMVKEKGMEVLRGMSKGWE